MRQKSFRLLGILIFFVSTLSPVLVQGQKTIYPTQWINPLPDLYVVTYGNSLYVAAGAAGSIDTSPDGVHWASATDGSVTNDLQALCASNGQFVAAGTDGQILVSTNGTNWTPAVSPTTNTWFGAAYGGGMFALVGQGGAIAVSSNGVAWQLASSGVSNDIPGIAFGNGTFAAIEATNVLTSGDGVNWAVMPLAEPTDPVFNAPCQSQGLNSIAFGNGLFYIAGIGLYPFYLSIFPKLDKVANLRSSPDGTNWTFEYRESFSEYGLIETVPPVFDAMAVEPDFIVASGRARASTGYNPVGVFTHSTINGDENLVLQANVLADGNSVTAGADGFVAVGSSGFIAYSPDATNWMQESLEFPTEWNSLVKVSNLYLGGSDTGLLISTNGVQYSFATNNPLLQIYGVAVGGGRYVAVGDAVLVSTNGNDWSLRNSGAPSLMTSVCWAGNQFVMVGWSNFIATSPTGDGWTQRASGTSENLEDVVSGGGLTVAVATGGLIVTSPDGINWTAQYSGVLNDLTSVAYAQGQFVVAGVGGTIITSPDGVNWTPQSSGTTATLRSVIFDDGMFFTVGDAGTILTSGDGSVWTQYALIPAFNIRVIAPNAGGYLLAADNGDMVLIGQLGNLGMSAPQLTGHVFGLTFRGVPRQGYRLQYSQDFSTWVDLFGFTNGLSTTNLVDPSPLAAHRFYRVLAQ